jgi:mannosyl-oligosaccharide glucosidase
MLPLLSLDILKSWVGLIDENGWVAREQILGEEARSKVYTLWDCVGGTDKTSDGANAQVPAEFQVQYPNYANPPTLTMAVTAYIRRLRQRGVELSTQLGELSRMDTSNTASSSDPAGLADRHLEDLGLASNFLKSIYPALRRHYFWFRSTQRGQIREWGRQSRSKTEAYRWRGRTADHVLTSGLDDYPRAKPPHVGELHLDLISWMGFFTRTMKEIAEFVGEEDDVAEFEEVEQAILANIDGSVPLPFFPLQEYRWLMPQLWSDLHWSEEQKMYCDVSVNEEGKGKEPPISDCWLLHFLHDFRR